MKHGKVGTLHQFEAAHVRPVHGRTLIVGSFVVEGKPDRRGLYNDAVGVDMRPGPGVDLVINLEDELPEIGTFAHIECMSVLEHSRRPWLMAANLERLLEPGGSIFVSAPFVWRVHAYPDDYFRFTVNGLKSLFTQVEWKAEAFASDRLAEDTKIRSTMLNCHPYLSRTESCLFGHRL